MVSFSSTRPPDVRMHLMWRCGGVALWRLFVNPSPATLKVTQPLTVTCVEQILSTRGVVNVF